MMWWQRFWRRKQMEEQLEKELRFHIEQHTADLIAKGSDPGEARRQAHLNIGGPEQVKEDCRDARGTRWLEDFLQDFRYALRTLRQRPGFAIVTLCTLALGIAATTVMFAVINGVLLKPLPYPHADRLVALQEETDKANEYGNRWAFAYPNYIDCKREARSFAPMAAWRYNGGTVSAPGDAEYVEGVQATADLFSLLGINVIRGRLFEREDDRPGAAPVAIISYAMWQRRYGASPAAVGMPLIFDAKPYTVVGVMPAGLRLAGSEFDLFTPLGQESSPSIVHNRARHPGIQVYARLAPGTTLPEAQSELSLIGRQLAAQYPDSNKGRTFVAEQLKPDVSDVRSTLWLLLGAVGVVLLIACVNIASLLLARAVSRERELAMRVALGAGRGRLVRQCLTESAVLGLCGGALGVALAAAGIRPFVSLWPGSLPRAEEIQVDWHVLLFALGVSLACGVLFGLAPALRVPTRRLEHILRSGGRSVPGGSRRLHETFVVAEMALALVLLICAGMLGRTLLKLSTLDPGVNVHNVLVTRMALSPAVLANPKQIPAAWQEVLDQARRVPGVESVAAVDTFPMRAGYNEAGYSASPTLPQPDQAPAALITSVTPDYLKVMGIALLKGRFFDEHDRIGSERVVVIDDVLAHQAFGTQDPVGKRLWIPARTSPFSVVLPNSEAVDDARIVGVVRHVRHWGLAGDDQARIRAQFYYPFAQVPEPLLRRWSELMSIAVRTSVPPLTVLQPLRHAVRGAGGDQALYEVRTMEQLAASSLAQQRFLLLLFGAFAGLALLLACIGIYGVLAYLTGQRVPEFGVRMALGASGRNVMQLVLLESAVMTLAGAAIGTSAGIAAGHLLQRLITGMQRTQATTLAITIFVLTAAALIASLVPARRASRVDPMTALRQE